MDLKVWNEAVSPHRLLGLLGDERIAYPRMLEFGIRCCRLIESDLDERQLQLLNEIDRKRAVDVETRQKAEALRLENAQLNKPDISIEEDRRFWKNSAIYSLFQDEESYSNKTPIDAGDADLVNTHQRVCSFIARKFVNDPSRDPPPQQLFEANEAMARMLREIVPNPPGT